MIVFLSKQVEEREMLPALPSPLFSTLNSSCQSFCTKCYKYVHHESEAVWALIVFLSDTSFWCLMQGNGIPEAERKKKEVNFFWCVWYGTLLSILYLLWLPVSLIIMNSWWNLWFKSSLWFHIESKWQFISVQMGKLWRCECDRRAKTLFCIKNKQTYFSNSFSKGNNKYYLWWRCQLCNIILVCSSRMTSADFRVIVSNNSLPFLAR